MEDRTYFWTMFFVLTLCFTNLDGAIFPIALEGLENLYGGETHDTGPIIARRQEEPVQNEEEAVTEKVAEDADAKDDAGDTQKMGAQYILPDGKEGTHLPATKSDMGAQYILPDGKEGTHLPATKDDMGAEYVLPDGKEGTHLPESILTRSTRCSTGREITVGPDFMLSSSEGGDNKIDEGNSTNAVDNIKENDEDIHTTTKRTGRPYIAPGKTRIPGHYIDDN